mmetsp:Transcript_50739/g.164097  ORF Transcript_50739/g.164097 Transcript_50739/m.164097 type:complete len:244 (-) Transcript_50739:541-1272(-)
MRERDVFRAGGPGADGELGLCRRGSGRIRQGPELQLRGRRTWELRVAAGRHPLWLEGEAGLRRSFLCVRSCSGGVHGETEHHGDVYHAGPERSSIWRQCAWRPDCCQLRGDGAHGAIGGHLLPKLPDSLPLASGDGSTRGRGAGDGSTNTGAAALRAAGLCATANVRPSADAAALRAAASARPSAGAATTGTATLCAAARARRRAGAVGDLRLQRRLPTLGSGLVPDQKSLVLPVRAEGLLCG